VTSSPRICSYARRSSRGSRCSISGSRVSRTEKRRCARADVFALGCLLYELLTGIAPFRADTFVAALARVLLEDPPPVRDHAPGVPAELDALVARMLAKDPGERPRDAVSVVDAFRAIGLPVALEPSERPVARAVGEA